MEFLCDVYEVLKQFEKKRLWEYYDLNFKNSKRWQILFLVKQGCRSNQSAILEVYKDKSRFSPFSLMKKKVKADILDALILGDEARKFKNVQTRVELEIIKGRYQCIVLLGRGAKKSSVQMLKKLFDKSIDYQLIQEAYSISFMLVRALATRNGFKEVLKYQKEINSLEFELSLRTKIEYCYLFLGLKNIFETNEKIVIDEVFLNYLSFISNNIEQSNNDYNHIHFALIESNLSLMERDLESAIEFNLKALHLTQKSRLFSISRHFVAGVSSGLVKLYLLSKDYQNSIFLAEPILKVFNPKMINYLIVLDIYFRAHFFSNNISRAIEITSQALSSDSVDSNAMRKARWLYYQSVLSYITGDRDLALKQLRANNEIHKDKTGWLLGFKLLEMMITIDNTDYYLATFQIERLNQVIHKNKHANVARVKIISQIIKAFLKYNCNFQETMDRVPDKFDLLEKEEGEYFWDPLGFEMIRFELWFKERA